MGGLHVRFRVILFNYQNKYLEAGDAAPLFRQGGRLSPSQGLTARRHSHWGLTLSHIHPHHLSSHHLCNLRSIGKVTSGLSSLPLGKPHTAPVPLKPSCSSLRHLLQADLPTLPPSWLVSFPSPVMLKLHVPPYRPRALPWDSCVSTEHLLCARHFP